MLAQEVLCMHGTFSHEQPWEIVLDLYFYMDHEEIKKEEQAVAKKAVTRRKFRVNGRLQILSSLLLNLKSQTGLEASRCPLPLFSIPYRGLECLACHWRLVCSSLCSGHWMGRNNYWVILSCSSIEANKMEKKSMENKQFLKKKKKTKVELFATSSNLFCVWGPYLFNLPKHQFLHL